ncbi:hypothetical protein [Paenarthrobacter sp. NPDC057981]|uniref:hypothetical protein n=1 Tax=Paenarthrobacter sp. NPDC057981 TaxID=3346297 RepID=UPI0036D9D0EB
MTDQRPEIDQFEAARAEERIIAESLWSTRPIDKVWDKLTYVRMETGGTGGYTTVIYNSGQEIGRMDTEDEVLFAAKRLRQAMYLPGKGTWLSMTLSITPAGDGWECTFEYYDKPAWELGDPGSDSYARELYLFPRDEEHIPDWFKEEMKGATWTPKTD